jgi:hypothetical protein
LCNFAGYLAKYINEKHPIDAELRADTTIKIRIRGHINRK